MRSSTITKNAPRASASLFLEEFERQVIAIAAMPERWMFVVHDIQRSLMKRFPYVIYFRAVDGASIRITVVKHEKRHPLFGLSRR